MTELSRRHRLSDTLGALARVPHVVRLHLSGLNADDVRRFVATTAGVAPPAWLTSAIHSQTEGNPLFVREVVRLLAQDGHFSEAAPATPPAIRLPEGVREVIGRRLNLLLAALQRNPGDRRGDRPGVRAGRAACAPASRGPRKPFWKRWTKRSPRTSSRRPSPGLYQFTHALVRITLYDELRTGQRRRLHHAVGEAIEAVASTRSEPGSRRSCASFPRRRHGRRRRTGDRLRDPRRTERGRRARLRRSDQSVPERARHARHAQRRRSGPAMRAVAAAGRRAAQGERLPAGAGDLARRRRHRAIAAVWASLFAEAAYAYADTAWRYTAHVDSRSGPLLEEALAGLPETDAGLRIKLMGSLARDRLHTGRSGRGESARVARRSRWRADLAIRPRLATSLGGLADFPWLPHETEQMLADAKEMAEMGERANDLEVAMRGHFRRIRPAAGVGRHRQAPSRRSRRWATSMRD